MNRQPPPQTVSQLREWNLFPQTLRLPDPQDAHNRHIRMYIQDIITLSYLRVIVKPHKRYHGSDFQRPHERENIRTPGFNDRVQYISLECGKDMLGTNIPRTRRHQISSRNRKCLRLRFGEVLSLCQTLTFCIGSRMT
jgi:hypothetical protein